MHKEFETTQSGAGNLIATQVGKRECHSRLENTPRCQHFHGRVDGCVCGLL